MLQALREYKWLRRLGVSDEDILRALRLARRSALVRLGRDEAVVAVPSQRLGSVSPERTVTHRDLAQLITGREARITTTRVGRLPEDQQLYMVRVRRNGAECQCPATRLAGDPLCVHKLAAAIVLYRRGRLDLLEWLPRAIEEKKRWRATRRRETRERGQATSITSYAG